MRVIFAALAMALLSLRPAMAVEPASYDCTKNSTSIAQFVCGDSDLSRADLVLWQPYYALRQQAGPPGWPALREEAHGAEQQMHGLCGIDSSGDLPDRAELKLCILEEYHNQTSLWMARLSGPASEEARRAIELHIELQRRLQSLGFLPPAAKIDGVYGDATRRAILAWQQSLNRATTGFLSDADSAILIPPPPALVPGPQPTPLPVQIRFPITRNPKGGLQIEVSGAITPGDAAQFEAAIQNLREAALVVLNSPGGEVENGLSIARQVFTRGWNTHVSAKCFSMCFVIFSAGRFRSFAPGASIGVHSASTHPNQSPDYPLETPGSFASTMEIVRAIQSFNQARPIPEAILGKLVSKARDDIAILSPGDLLAMDAVMDPPSIIPAITPAVEREARDQAPDRAEQWISAYKSTYARGVPPIFCRLDLGCLAGARDYATAVGMPEIAAEANRYAILIPRPTPAPKSLGPTPSAATPLPLPSPGHGQSVEEAYAIAKNFYAEHPIWSAVIVLVLILALGGFAEANRKTLR